MLKIWFCINTIQYYIRVILYCLTVDYYIVMLSCSQLPKIQQTGSYSGDAGACSPQPPICVHESGVFDTLRNLRSCPILEATKSVQ